MQLSAIRQYDEDWNFAKDLVLFITSLLSAIRQYDEDCPSTTLRHNQVSAWTKSRADKRSMHNLNLLLGNRSVSKQNIYLEKQRPK